MGGLFDRHIDISLRLREMRPVATALVALIGLTVTVSAQQNKSAQAGAEFLLGHVFGNLAILSECGDRDKQNAVAYANAIEQYYTEMSPTVDRLNHVLDEEEKRGALPRYYFADRIRAATNIASAAAKADANKDPTWFIIGCHAQLIALSKHALAYSPLRDRFPKQVDAVEKWK